MLQALGVTVVFSIMKLINFSHGELYALGAYVAYFFSIVLGLPPIIAVLGAILASVGFGWIINYFFIRPVYTGKIKGGEEFVIAVTFGLSLFIQNAIAFTFGLYPRSAVSIVGGKVHLIGDIYTSGGRLVAFIGCGIALLFTIILIYRTRLGKAVRAVSQNSEAAVICGINSDRIYAFSFILSAVLAGLAGALVAPFLLISPGSGGPAIMLAFVIVVLGGLGSVSGVVVGSLAIATVQQLTVSLIPDLHMATAYIEIWGLVVLILVLILRPNGLFGEKVRLT